MAKVRYHQKAIDKGRPLFGPSDLATGSYLAWLESRRGESDKDVEAFHGAMLKASKAWEGHTGDRGSSGQRALMLDTFEFPEVIERLLQSEP